MSEGLERACYRAVLSGLCWRGAENAAAVWLASREGGRIEQPMS